MEIQTITLEANSGRPGRTLTQFDISKIAEALGEVPLFPYLVKMQAGGSPAGNHYHENKQELFVCVEGTLKVAVADPTTSERAEIVLKSDAEKPAPALEAVVIPAHLAHAVENIGSSNAGLLVFASRQAWDPDDNFYYKVI